MEGERRSVNSELWHACAGPCVSLPSVGSLVVYFPQGHSEQVAASTQKEVAGHIPNYPNLQSQLVCQLHNVALHADLETDEVFAQMTLQPVNEQERDLFLPPDVGTPNRQPSDFFCKTLTASDTSTHGGFSVPRRAAEKVFPKLDFNKQPPAQELRARDLHDNVWTFRHIYRGQPKRHLLTTGWSVFVSAKRLVAGDSVLFIRDDKGQMLLGIRRATSRQQSVMPSSVLSSDSMHIGVLAAAAHAAATSSRFQVFYNPRTSPSEFIIPLSKYRKAVHFTQVSVGMRFRMVFETDESTLRRYMGTVTGIGDLDPNRWPGSKWRNLEVGWDESSAGERPRRVSLWEIEPVSSPLLICPPFASRLKRPNHADLLGDENDMDGSMKRCLTWLQGENGLTFQGLGGESSWIQFQQGADPNKPEVYDALQAFKAIDVSMAPALQGKLRLLHTAPQDLQPQGIWPLSNGQQQGYFQSHQLQSQMQMPLPLGSIPSTQGQAQLSSHSQPLPLPQTNNRPLTQPHLPSSQLADQQQQRLQQGQTHKPLLSYAAQRAPLVSHTDETPIQTHKKTPHMTDVASNISHNRAQTPITVPLIAQGSESDASLGTSSGSISRFSSIQGNITGRSHFGNFHLEDSDQLSSIIQANQSVAQMLPQQQPQPQPQLQLQPQLQSQPQIHPKTLSQPQTVRSHHHSHESLPSLAQIESQLTGHWFSIPRETTQCESPMVSAIQIGHSDTSSSAVTSCSYPLPADTLDNNSSLVPNASISLQANSSSSNKELQTQGLNEAIIGTFSSSNGSLRSTMPDGGLCANSGIMANGVLDDQVFQRTGSSHWSPVAVPVRTFTKVHKSGSVGRSIDLSRLKSYSELRSELARMFNIEGQLEEPQRSYWQLVFVDNVGDILLVGDDPWEEFVSCVRAIKILSTAQVLEMNQEGLEQISNLPLQQQTSVSSEDCHIWKES